MSPMIAQRLTLPDGVRTVARDAYRTDTPMIPASSEVAQQLLKRCPRSQGAAEIRPVLADLGQIGTAIDQLVTTLGKHG